jgi:PadR family transcriptional regulator PadR
MNTKYIEVHNLTKSLNETLILSILVNEKLHGYQLALEIEKKSDGLFKFNHGTLYPILHKLEKQGLISGSWKQEGPKRKRKYYKITGKGRKHINAQRLEWEEIYKLLFNILGGIEK